MKPSASGRPTPTATAGETVSNPFRQATFLLSAARLDQLPRDESGEVAFVGRSNAGKSSAMNILCDHRALARVSRTPGRTQLINLFTVPAGGRLVDLPGYGFSKAPLATKHAWGQLVGGYMEHRPNLRGSVIVMDIRHPLTDLDWQMLEWGQAREHPAHVLLTKADKLGFGAQKTALMGVQKLLAERMPGVSAQTFSSETRLGLDATLAVVRRWLGLDPGADSAGPAG